jgi:hypothetical protein
VRGAGAEEPKGVRNIVFAFLCCDTCYDPDEDHTSNLGTVHRWGLFIVCVSMGAVVLLICVQPYTLFLVTHPSGIMLVCLDRGQGYPRQVFWGLTQYARRIETVSKHKKQK